MEKHRYALQIKLVELEENICQPSDSVFSQVITYRDGIQHAVNSDYASYQGNSSFRFANNETVVQVDPCSCQNMTPAQLKNLFPSTSPITLHDVLSNQRTDDPQISSLVKSSHFVTVEIRRSATSVLCNSSSQPKSTSLTNTTNGDDQVVGTLFLSTHDRAGLQVHHLYNHHNHHTGRVVLLWFPMLPQLLISLPTYQQPEKKFFSFAQDETTKKYAQRRTLLEQFLKLLFKPNFSEQSDVYQQFYEELSGVAKELQEVDFRAMFFEQLTPIEYQLIKDVASGGTLAALSSSKESKEHTRASEQIGNKIGLDVNPPYLTHPSITAIFLIFLNMCLNFANQSRDFTSVYHILQLSSNFSYIATVLSAIKHSSSSSPTIAQPSSKLHTTFLCSAYSIIKEHALVKSTQLWNFVYIEAVKSLDAMYTQYSLSNPGPPPTASLLTGAATNTPAQPAQDHDGEIQLFKHKFWSRRLAHISQTTLHQQRGSVPALNLKKEDLAKQTASDVCPYQRLYLQFEAKYNASRSNASSTTSTTTPNNTSAATTTYLQRTGSQGSVAPQDLTISFGGDDLNAEKPSYLQNLQYRIAHHYATIHGTSLPTTAVTTSTTATNVHKAPNKSFSTTSSVASHEHDESNQFRQQYEHILSLSAKDKDFILLIQLIICQLMSIGEDTQQIIAFIIGLNLDKSLLPVVVSWWDTQQLIVENYLPERALYKELTQSSDSNWVHCRSTFDLPPRMEPSSELYPAIQRYSGGDFWVQQQSTTITTLLTPNSNSSNNNSTTINVDPAPMPNHPSRSAAGKLDWGKEPKRPLPIHVSLIPPTDWSYYDSYVKARNAASHIQGTASTTIIAPNYALTPLTEEMQPSPLFPKSPNTLTPSSPVPPPTPNVNIHPPLPPGLMNDLSTGTTTTTIASAPNFDIGTPCASVSSDDPSMLGDESDDIMDFSDEDEDDFLTKEELALFRSSSGIGGDEPPPMLPENLPPPDLPSDSSDFDDFSDEDFDSESVTRDFEDTSATESDGASGFAVQKPLSPVKPSAPPPLNVKKSGRLGRNADVSSDEEVDDFPDLDAAGNPVGGQSANLYPTPPATPTRPKSYSTSTPSISRNAPPPVPLRAPSISRNGSGYTPTLPQTITATPAITTLVNPTNTFSVPLNQATPGIVALTVGLKNNKRTSSVAYDPVFTSIAMRRHRESLDFFTDDLQPLTTLGLPEVGELAEDASYSSMLPVGHTMHRRGAFQMSSRTTGSNLPNRVSKTNTINGDATSAMAGSDMGSGQAGWTRIPFDYMHGETALLTLDVYCLDMPSLLHYATRARRVTPPPSTTTSTTTTATTSTTINPSMIPAPQGYQPSNSTTLSQSYSTSNSTTFAPLGSDPIYTPPQRGPPPVLPHGSGRFTTSTNTSTPTLPSLLSQSTQSPSILPPLHPGAPMSTPMSVNTTLSQNGQPPPFNSLTNHHTSPQPHSPTNQQQVTSLSQHQLQPRSGAGTASVQWFPKIPLHSVDNVNVSFSVSPGQHLPGQTSGVSYPHDANMPKSMSQTQDHPHIEPDLEISVSNLQRVLDDAVSRGKLTLTNYRLIYSPYVYMNNAPGGAVAHGNNSSGTSFSLNGAAADLFHGAHNKGAGNSTANHMAKFGDWVDPPQQSAHCAEPNCSRCIEQRCRRVFGTIPLQCIHRLEQVDATDAKAKSFQMSILDEFKKIDQSKHMSSLTEQQQAALVRNVSVIPSVSKSDRHSVQDNHVPDKTEGMSVVLNNRANPASPSLHNQVGRPQTDAHSTNPNADLQDPNFGDTPLTSDILFRLITQWCMGSARHIDVANPSTDHDHNTHGLDNKEEVLLHIRCKDSRQTTFCIKHTQFGKSPQQLWGHFCRQLQSAAYGKQWNSIADAGPRYPPHVNELAYRINSIAPDKLKWFSQFFQLYAFIMSSNKKSGREANGWDVYNPRREYERQGCLASGDFIEYDNTDYKLCQTYPSTLYFQWRTKQRGNTAQANLPVTQRELDEMVGTVLPKAAKYRSKGRIPTVSFFHATTGGTLLRSAQPLSGLTNGRSSSDEDLCNRASITVIFDARPKANAQANKMKGGGFEPKPEKYNSILHFCDIENIHKMRTALKEITTICREACPHVLITNSYDAGIIHSTMIFQHAARIIANAEAHQRQLQQQQQPIVAPTPQHHQLALTTPQTDAPSLPPRRPAPLPPSNLPTTSPVHEQPSRSSQDHHDPASRIESTSRVGTGPPQPPPRNPARRGSFASSVTYSQSHLHSYTGVRAGAHGGLYMPSATDLIARCGVKTLPERYGQLVESEWPKHITGLLLNARLIAQHLLEGKSCLARCSDGWDRTSQMCALASIMVDPYYRTIEGFAVIIEKEFLSFGHKFSDRCGHASNNHSDVERSPIFIQFLDAVYQLLVQNPQAFEFDDSLLHYIATHTYSCKYGTFLFNSHRERNHIVQVQLLTVSIWDVVVCKHKNKFVNPYYEPTLSPPLQRVFPPAPAKLGDKCDQTLIDLAEQSAMLWVDSPWVPWNFYFRWDLRTVYEYKV